METLESKTALLMLSGGVPQQHAQSAGHRFVSDLCRARETWSRTLYVTTSTEASRAACDELVAGVSVVLADQAAWSRPLRPLAPAIARGENLIRRVDPTITPMGPALWLRSHIGRAAVSGADVIDLQWMEYIRTVDLMKRINPRARVVGTFHDVMSQLFARKADQATKVERLRWASRNIITSVRERHVLDRLDRVVTLNEKDAELLEELGASGVTVLNPPLLATHFERRPQPTRVVVVGYYAREVNVQGVSWMVRKVWPIVRQHVPHAELLLVGSDPHEALGAFKSVPGVRAVGFVEDLDEIYESAAVVAVPLLMGSGVKFKTIEAVVRGIPVVSTSIGAEGVPDLAPEWICDDATGFASRILDIMRDPTSADNRARRGASAAQSRYGWDRFIDEVHTIYAR